MGKENDGLSHFIRRNKESKDHRSVSMAMPRFLFLLLAVAISLPFSSAWRNRCHPEDAQILSEIFHRPIVECCKIMDTNCNVNTSWIDYLTIKNGAISGVLSPSLGKMTNLYSLILLRLPNVQGGIPPEIANLTKLTSLVISYTNISGPVPDWLGQLKNLKSSDLSYNQLSGSIPPSINAWPATLTYLSLQRNRLSGPIPESFARLPPFIGVDLSHNELAGAVPKSLSVVDLGYIDLNRNQLEGDPSHLFSNREKSLTRIDLSRNLFAFDLSDVVFPVNLSSIDLSHNKIRGSISLDVLRLKELNDFNVSYNRLCGKIPQGGAMQTLSSWSFAHNSCLCGPPLSDSC